MKNQSAHSTYFDVIQPYIIGVAIGAGLIGFGQGISIPGLSSALTYAGIILDVILFTFGLFEYWRARDMFYTMLNIQRSQNGLPLIHFDVDMFKWHNERKAYEQAQEPKIESQPQNSKPVITFDVQPNNGGFTSQRKEFPNPPTELFLQCLFSERSSVGSIPSEAVFADIGKNNGQWNGEQSDKWLSDCDRAGILRRAWESKNNNAPRMIVGGMTIELALEKFGLSPASHENKHD